MSDSSGFDFGKFIPGFDFLQNLAAGGKGPAGAAPGLHPWVAPTVSVEELDKRIAELKAVLFWLEQNGTALKATIQALEVQKLTLATLQGMNLSMAEVAKAFTLPTQDPAAAAPTPEVAPAAPQHWPYAVPASEAPVVAKAAAAVQPEPEPEPEPEPSVPRAAAARKPKAAAPAPGLADPVQWWGALTQQFQQIAANAMRDTAHATPAGAASADAAASSRPAAKKTAGKPAVARKPAAKKPAARKPAAKKSAKRPAMPPAADAQPTDSRSAGGWPLPPPFKLHR